MTDRVTSQSPSLRGSGRFLENDPDLQGVRLSLNPLHCGAVVASPRRRNRRRMAGMESQSPSLRGSGRFSPR